jgi:hypothetical protein
MQPTEATVPTGTETPKDVNEGQTQQTPPTDAPSDAPKAPEEPKVDETAAELERVKNELNKARMRENQLKKEQEDAERKRLEEANEFKSLYEQERQARIEREEREAAEQEQNNLRQLRDSVIDDYKNPVVKEAAKALIEQNPNALFWAEATDEVGAKAEVTRQLDALASKIGTPPAPSGETNPTPPVDGNNPLPPDAPAERTQSLEDKVKELEKKLTGVTF